MNNSQLINISSAIKGVIIITIVFLAAGCSKNIKHQTIEEMVLQAKSKVKVIEAEELKPLIENTHSYLIIDCRNAEDFKKGHIPVAINIPRGLLEFSDKISDRQDQIIIYGYNDDCSALSAETLQKLKYHHLKMINNGWDEWSKLYPDIFEIGTDEPENESPPPPPKESGGCG